MLLRYLLPSVVDISGAGIERAVVINKKTLNHKNKTKYVRNSNTLTLILPSVVVISGAEKEPNK